MHVYACMCVYIVYMSVRAARRQGRGESAPPTKTRIRIEMFLNSNAYGCILVYMAICGCMWLCMGVYRCIWLHMVVFGFICSNIPIYVVVVCMWLDMVDDCGKAQRGVAQGPLEFTGTAWSQ